MNPEHHVTVYELLEYIYENLCEEPQFTPAQLADYAKIIAQEKADGKTLESSSNHVSRYEASQGSRSIRSSNPSELARMESDCD